MTDEDQDDGEITFYQPEPIIISAGDGAIIIPDLDALTEALGGDVIAYSTDSAGALYFMTSAREWSPVEQQKRGKLKAVEKPN